jgi:hypothetical protein
VKEWSATAAFIRYGRSGLYLRRWLALLQTVVPAAARSDVTFATAVIRGELPWDRQRTDPGGLGQSVLRNVRR